MTSLLSISEREFVIMKHCRTAIVWAALILLVALAARQQGLGAGKALVLIAGRAGAAAVSLGKPRRAGAAA